MGQRAAPQTSQRGQSLVETALITPLLLLMFLGVIEVGWALRGYLLLLLMFLGVIEVGWALRGYLVLLNANREATRFAARGAYLDFSQPDIEKVGYQFVLQHALDSLSDQLLLDFIDEPNATMIITHLDIDTGYPCEDQDCDDECSANPDSVYPNDDLVILPPPVGAGYGSDPALIISDTFRAQYGIGAPNHTTLITDTLWEGLRAQNEALNCQLMLSRYFTTSPSCWAFRSFQIDLPIQFLFTLIP
jgi:hypothetical protein